MSVIVYPPTSASATSTAARLTIIAVHENQRTLRLNMASTTGAMIRTPPRSSTRMNTTDTPPNVKARVVVPMIVARQSPDKKVQRPGNGMLTPNNSRRPAYFHHLITVMNPNIETTVAITEAGNSTSPVTGSFIPGNSPNDIALVSPLYGV